MRPHHVVVGTGAELLDGSPRLFPGVDAERLSLPLEALPPFDQALVSWNVTAPPGSGFAVDLRVGRLASDLWSPWLEVGAYGAALPDGRAPKAWDRGRIDVDYFTADERFDRLQVRVRAAAIPGAAGPLEVARLAVCTTDRALVAAALARAPAGAGPASANAVPERSQQVEDESIRRRICSPTALAMVLAWRGVELPTVEVARAAYDAESGLYGNWPRAVQTAWTFGVPGYLARYSDWSEVEELLARGQPLIASIGVRAGELAGAPYEDTAGHLVVLTGADGAGGIRVNDPAAEPGSVARVYSRAELTRVWMARGGTAYVLLPRD